MAIVKLAKDGYGQLELNQVAFRRDGRIEAQCKLNATAFPAGATAIGRVAENGMLFEIDNVKRELNKATTSSALVGLNYSAEHMYDERKPGLKNFYLAGDDVYPRLGLLDIGDKFHTNTVCYDEDVLEDEEAIEDAIETGLYAQIASDGSGYWELVEINEAEEEEEEGGEAGTGEEGGEAGTGEEGEGEAGAGEVGEGEAGAGEVGVKGLLAQVLALTTMPDGQPGVKLQVIRV